jgi:hypothetical protein
MLTFHNLSPKRFVLRSSAIILVAWSAIVSVQPASAQGTYGLEPVGAPRVDIPKALRDKLEANGTRLYRVERGLHVALYEVWWSKSVPMRDQPHKQPALVYGQLLPGTLLGVLYLPNPGADFHEHKLGPGFFTMRYANVSKLGKEKDDDDKDKKDKDDKSKKGRDADDEDENAPRVSPYLDFVLLSKVETDTKIGSTLGSARLVKLSQQVSGAEEPASISLVPVNRLYKGFPSVVSDDQGNCSVQFKLQGRTPDGRTAPLDLSIRLVTPPDFGRDD